MSQVILEHISKHYVADRRSDLVYAVRDLSMEIAQGEFLVLLGPSGCGKSTTLRLIAGLEEISEGTLRMGGRVVNDVEPKDRDIAMVFQNYALYPHMTVRENMSFGLELRKMDRKEIDQRVEGAASMLNLSALLHRLPKELSGGQRQRVAVGRAIVRQPQVFLFDEPLSNLDAQMRTQMRTELTRLHRNLKATMIYVTHDQTEAMTMGDRIAVMNQGKLQQLARPTDLYENPANLFVAGFVGTPPMNFFEGELVSRGDVTWFEEKNPESLKGASPLRFPVPRRYVGKATSVVAGFRAEQFRVGCAPAASPCTLRGVVELVERLGAETLVHIRRGTHRFTVRAPASIALGLDEECEVFADPAEVRLFEAQSGSALL